MTLLTCTAAASLTPPSCPSCSHEAPRLPEAEVYYSARTVLPVAILVPAGLAQHSLFFFHEVLAAGGLPRVAFTLLLLVERQMLLLRPLLLVACHPE